MEIVTFAVAALCVLFTLISVAIPISERVRLPLPVVLGTGGLALGLIGSLPGFDPLASALDAYNLWIVGSLALDGQTLLLVFLPPLLFEMALSVNVRRLIEDVAIVVLMAVVAVVLATGFVGLALWSVSSIGLVACLLLGAAISTTDPAAVVTTFRQIGAPRRLLVILEGESLLNDAAAIALFTLLIGLAGATEAVRYGAVVPDFLYSFGAGALCGVAVAWLASRLYSLLGGSAVAEVTMTVALAYGSYLIAQDVLIASGVVSVVFAGLTTTVVGTVRMGPRNWSTVVSVWTQVGFWANALILVLAATIAPRMLLQLSLVESLYLIVVFAGAFAARAIVLFGMLPALSLLGMTAPITQRQKALVMWGGVRGAVTLVLALSLAELTAVDEDDRRVIAALAAGFVFATLLLNASTLAWTTRRLGLDRLSPADVALRERVIAGTVEEVRFYVAELARERAIEPAAVAKMHTAYEPQIRETIAHSEAVEIPFGERLRLGLTILGNQEIQVVQRAFEDGAIGPRQTRELRAVAERIADATRIGGRSAYEAGMAASVAIPRVFRTALAVQRYLRIDAAVRYLLASRLGLLLETENTVRELRAFVRNIMAPMVGTDTADNLADLIEQRLALVRSHIDAIRLQYPHYTEAFERTLLLRAAARREEAQYSRLLADGIIGTELHRALNRDLHRRWRDLERLPRLDLGMSPDTLVAQVALFAALDSRQRHLIAKRLRSRMAVPGQVIVAEGERGDAMYYVAFGVLEVRGLDHEAKLSNGDFFGELALISPTRRRRTAIVAASYCRLLVLTRRDFRRLRSVDPKIEILIREAAERQLGDGFLMRVPEEREWRGETGARPAA